MTLRSLLLVVMFFGFAVGMNGQVQLEKPLPSETAPAQPAAPEREAVPAPAPTVTPAPAPPAEPPTESPFGLLILAVILAHVCLPVSLILCLVVLLLGLRVFRGGLTKVLMGIAAAGGAKGLKGFLSTVGCIVVVPAGFLGLNWAARWLDHPVSGPTWWIYGLAVSVVTGLVFFSLMKAIARVLKQRLVGKMGAGIMGNLGGQRLKQARGKSKNR